jgi:dipeptidyl aminopeptidase/acylaminoacyl peptidase
LGLTNPSAGFDGGGGYLEQSSRVQAVINMFGPTDNTKDCADRVAKQVFGAKKCQDTEPLEKAGPMNYVTSDAPPFLFLQGDKDRLVPPEQTRLLHERLVTAGVPSKPVIVENAGHGFTPDGGEIDPSIQELGRIMIDFFNEMLK